MKKSVLVVGVDSATFAKIAPVLSRDDLAVDRFPGPEGALALLAAVPFSAILVRFPLPGTEVSAFLDAVRGRGRESACVRSAIVLLADKSNEAEARKLIGMGANRVLTMEEQESALQAALAGLLEVAHRISMRFMARVEVKVGSGTSQLICQTENLSATGMLLRTDRKIEIGTRIGFEFQLPDEPAEIRGVAEVRRYSSLGREGVMGIGVEFVAFTSDGGRKLHEFLKRELGTE